jgi:uncharacterized protein
MRLRAMARKLRQCRHKLSFSASGACSTHSTLHQNVGWERDIKNLLITYTTLRDIKEGEELCISYGPRLTFRDVEEERLDAGPEDWTEVLNIIDLND